MDIGIAVELMRPWTEAAALSVARPYGLTMTFVVLAWFGFDNGVLRMAFAIALALPVFSLAGPQLPYIIEMNEIPVLVLLVKELLLGAIIGWLVSLPLIIASSAGAILDTYQGNSQGSTDPTGGQISSVANLFMVTSLGLFAMVGGLWIITDILYQSYATWPIYAPMPNIYAGFGVFLSMFSALIKAAFILAAPIVTVMFLSDMTFLLAAKLGKKINVTFLAFSTKAMIAVALLPVFSIVFVKVQKENFGQFTAINEFLRGLAL